jgi:hypothetical protein
MKMTVEQVNSEGLVAGQSMTLEVIGGTGPAGPPGPAGGDMLDLPANGAIGGHKAICNDNGSAIYADNTDLSTAHTFVGISYNAAADGDTVSIVTAGPVTEVIWSWTPQQPIYIGTGGNLTQTAPTSGYVRRIGFAETATTVFVQPSQPLFLGA